MSESSTAKAGRTRVVLDDGLGCREIGQCGLPWGLGCGYSFLMGVTGAAFKLTWGDGCRPDNVASGNLA